MKALISFLAVLLLAFVAYAGASVPGLRFLFGVVIPYAAIILFVVGMVVRILKWASSPVPFRIPTTTGQQKTLPWIKHSTIESPSSGLGVIARMALEVLVFRSLFRNLKTQVGDGGKQVAYGEDKWLWAAGLAFHWSFLIIGMLVVRGYPLYSQIWSDQPPLFTHMLAVLFRLVGFEVNAARVMVLILSGVLLWACCLYLRMTWGKTAALIGLITILLLPTYHNLSVSVMVGLPALAFAMLSLLSLIAWHQQRQLVWLSLSAIALSLSVLTKLFTGFLAPVFVIGITLDEFAHASRLIRGWHVLKMPVLWSGIFGGVTLLGVLALVGPGKLDQLIEPHLMAGQTDYFEAVGTSYTLWTHLAKAWLILALALMGGGIAIFESRWLAVYPFAWMVTATLLRQRT